MQAKCSGDPKEPDGTCDRVYPAKEAVTEERRKMSYADRVFIDMCNDILTNGTSTEGEKVRPKWEDGASAYTIKNSAWRTAMIFPKNFLR